MATWPSASKASTANLDSGTDSPAAARADLKTNVDNVNSVIDMFNIVTPADNQILKYSSANSRFELGTAGGGGAQLVGLISATAFVMTGGVVNSVINFQTEQYDPTSVITLGANSGETRGIFTITTAGTYLIEYMGGVGVSDPNTMVLRDHTGSVDIATSTVPGAGNDFYAPPLAAVHTITSSNDYYVRHRNSGDPTHTGTSRVKIWKLA